jgi:hypothetical protein
LLCVTSVYRSLEKEKYWLNQLARWLERLSAGECGLSRQQKALEELKNRSFVEQEVIQENGIRLVGQHTVVRSLALEHYHKFLQSLQN